MGYLTMSAKLSFWIIFISMAVSVTATSVMLATSKLYVDHAVVRAYELGCYLAAARQNPEEKPEMVEFCTHSSQMFKRFYDSAEQQK